MAKRKTQPVDDWPKHLNANAIQKIERKMKAAATVFLNPAEFRERHAKSKKKKTRR